MEGIRRSLQRLKKCSYSVYRTGITRSYSEDAPGSAGWERRIVTGIQPTGAMHVGNYFAAVRRCARLVQQGDDVTVFIADLHALTAPQEAGALSRRVLQTAALLVAGGVCPARATLFVQSWVPRHAELCWALLCLATQPRLQQLPQYRERAAAGPVPLGLMLYPVLQAADVLVHRGTLVPVGRDQVQHLQLAAHLARAFARRHGAAFPEPAALLPEDGSDRILSLRDPAKKMSKSDPDPKSRILMTDSDDAIRLKIRKAVTDLTPEVTFDPERRPGVSNLVRLHALAAGRGAADVAREAARAALTTHQYKRVVAEALVGHVRPVRERAAALLRSPAALGAVLRHGAARARARADVTHDAVARLLGTAPPRR